MLRFLKMHGLGNDFVVLDARQRLLPPLSWKKIADRRFGIGCDQVVVLVPSTSAAAHMQIYNADGSKVASCGNASRCIGALLMQEQNISRVSISTDAGVIEAWHEGSEADVTVDMGEPRLRWQEIPLAHAMDTLHVLLEAGTLTDAAVVNMGNPHAVFFVETVPDDAQMSLWGAALEYDSLFPERANISAVKVHSPEHLEVKVWERGAGLTLACGTAACASVVAAHLRHLSARVVHVQMPGGMMKIEWRMEDNHVLMRGAVSRVFEGSFAPEQFGA